MLDENALLVLRKRYLIKNEEGEPVETPDELFTRVARAIAQAEDHYKDGEREAMAEAFHHMMARLEFLPNSPTLMNAGRELGQLAACFVLPVEDSLDSIFDGVKLTAKIHQSGGGTGFSFSRLRPKGDKVATTMGVASGPVSFMKAFNMATEVIKQGGTRRGANMGILRIDHPDIEEFVTIKKNPQELVNFNLSVAVTDAFMQAFHHDDAFSLVNPRNGHEWKRVKARKLLREVAESAWATGDPGVIFIDTINRSNPTPHIGVIEATNPCAEQPLLPYESCCLGSINLSKVAQNGSINWEQLKELTHLGVRFLDNVIEISRFPAAEIDGVTRANRKIGLGVMGFAHLLIRMGIPYDAPEAQAMGGRIMGFIQTESKIASRLLAESRGTFPNYKGSIWEKRSLMQRNATTTTIAPTGTLSIIAGTSSGIEPIYDTRYTRLLLGDIRVEMIDPLYEEMKDKPVQVTSLFRKAYDVAPLDHLKIQRAFQKHVDNAVSKTVNLPENATPDTILDIYVEAHGMGLKGTTVFRDRSKEYQILSCGTNQVC
jgi:ribonucleoside-diphosphate reductase alpha chain